MCESERDIEVSPRTFLGTLPAEHHPLILHATSIGMACLSFEQRKNYQFQNRPRSLDLFQTLFVLVALMAPLRHRESPPSLESQFSDKNEGSEEAIIKKKLFESIGHLMITLMECQTFWVSPDESE